MLSVNIQEIRRVNGKAFIQILREISFEINSGTIYTITGKNGSGKTTLLKSLTSLLDKRFYETRGSVLFEGTDLLKLPQSGIDKIRNNKIKYVFQDSVSSFNPLKKLDYYFNILKPGKELLDLYIKELSLPSAAVLGRMHSYEMSGGMAQRLALAIALSVKPSLLLLDEPNSAVDNEMSRTFTMILRKYVKEAGAAVIMTTQDLEFAERTSDYTGFIDNGTFSGYKNSHEFFNGSAVQNASEMILAYKSL